MLGRLLRMLALALPLAGCILGPAAEVEPTLVHERIGYLSPEMTLVGAAPPRQAAVSTGSFFASWADGVDYPTWLADPLPVDALVQDVRVRLFVQATGPVLESARFPDIMVYAGSGDAWMGYGAAVTPSLLVPGRVYEFTVEVEVPRGGLFLPAGETFGVKVVPVMTQDDHRDVQILLGGATPSAVSWRQEPLDAPTPELTTGRDEGELAGSAYAGAAAPDSTSHATPLGFAAAPERLFAWMNTTSHDGIPDLDLSLVDPEGNTIASAGTPTPREALRLAAPNLAGPGDYRLVVTSYGSARAAFTLEWQVG